MGGGGGEEICTPTTHFYICGTLNSQILISALTVALYAGERRRGGGGYRIPLLVDFDTLPPQIPDLIPLLIHVAYIAGLIEQIYSSVQDLSPCLNIFLTYSEGRAVPAL